MCVAPQGLALFAPSFLPTPTQIILAITAFGGSLSGPISRQTRNAGQTHSGAKVQKRRAIYACGLILLTLLALTQLSYSAASKLTIVPRAKLCVTEGTIEESPGGELIVSVPKMRVCQCLQLSTDRSALHLPRFPLATKPH